MEWDMVQNLFGRIRKNIWICFFSGIVFGWMTHFYMLTHKLPNWDDIMCIDNFGSGAQLGRWFLKYIYQFGSKWSIPALHGMIGIVLLSVASCVIMEIFRLKSMTAAVLVPLLMLTFPSVASNMTFMFMMHTSALAILALCIAVSIARKYKYGVIPCGILLILVLAVYQSYIAFAISLLIFGLMFDLFNGKKTGIQVFWEGIKYVVMLGVSVFLYMQLCWWIYPNLVNEDYGGVGNMGNISISEMPHLMLRCYKRILDFFILKPFGFMSDMTHMLNILACLLVVGFFVFIIVKKQFYKKKLECVMLGLLAFFALWAMAFIYFMAPEVDYSMLMLYAYVLVYICLLALWEQAMPLWKNKLMQNIAAWLIMISLFLVAYQNYLVTNEAYFRMDIAFQRTVAYYERLIARLEQTEGYQYGEPVFIAGDFYYVDNPSPIEEVSMNDEKYREFSGIALENGMITAGVRNHFVETYLGIRMPEVPQSQKEQIQNSTEYQNMSVYPSEGCVRKIQDVWVIRLDE